RRPQGCIPATAARAPNALHRYRRAAERISALHPLGRSARWTRAAAPYNVVILIWSSLNYSLTRVPSVVHGSTAGSRAIARRSRRPHHLPLFAPTVLQAALAGFSSGTFLRGG